MEFVKAHRLGHVGGVGNPAANRYYRDDDLDREALARANLKVLLDRGAPPSVILEQLGGLGLLNLCPVCAREFTPQRRKTTCSRQCAGVLAGRQNLGVSKQPMTTEHKQKISAANKAFAAGVTAKKVPRR